MSNGVERTVNVTSGFSLGSMGFVLFLVFMILKLTGVIDWSWFYITLPLWIPTALYTFVIGVILTIVVIAGKIEDRKIRKAGVNDEQNTNRM